MSIYAVTVHHRTHTCSGDPQPHAVDTLQQVVHVTPGGPCRTPVMFRFNGTTTTVACGRRYPHHRQCPACRITVVTLQASTEHLGHTPAHHATVPAGHAPHPCTVCRQPLAAALARTGRHILCHPRPTRRGAA
ncbi:MAG TPA: hypothetical protein VFC00_13585 [Micromonosporaceae bacterium]|nr:hypothetical protein [Micromonosporaceae bacterium]